MKTTCKKGKMSPKSLLVLDLDETLIHSTQYGPAGDFSIHIDGTPVRYQIHVRPGAKSFLKKMHNLSDFMDLGVWTAATPAYASRILDYLFPEWRTTFSFLRTRSKCTTLPEGYLVKDLRHLRDWQDVMLLDDNDLHVRFNNAPTKKVMRIKPYTSIDLHDRELLKCGRKIHNCLLHGKRLSSLCV